MSAGGPANVGLTGMQATQQFASGFARGEEIRAQQNFVDSQLEINEIALKMQADDARARGIDRRVRIQEALKLELGRRRAKVGASGVLIGSGSAADVETSQRVVASLDELEAMQQAEREAFAFEFEAEQVAGRREMGRRLAKTARRNTIIAGGMQALGTSATAVNRASKLGSGPSNTTGPKSGTVEGGAFREGGFLSPGTHRRSGKRRERRR